MDNTHHRASQKGCILRVELIPIPMVSSPDPPHHAPSFRKLEREKGAWCGGSGDETNPFLYPPCQTPSQEESGIRRMFISQLGTNQDSNEYFTRSVNTKISSGDIVASFPGWVRGYSFVGTILVTLVFLDAQAHTNITTCTW